MRILLLGDNQICADAAYILKGAGAEIVALGLHAEGSRRCGEAIGEAAGHPPVFLPEEITDLDPRLQELRPELAVSVFYGHILPARFLQAIRTVNLHPAYLPFNRGAYPNIWPIIDGTPAGVTLHEVDTGVDTGPVLARKRVEVKPWDTGKTLYERLLDEARQLLHDHATDLFAGQLRAAPQKGDETFHRQSDVDAIDRLDLDATEQVGPLIDRLRARTFPPHKGCFFEKDGKRIYVRIELEPEP